MMNLFQNIVNIGIPIYAIIACIILISLMLRTWFKARKPKRTDLNSLLDMLKSDDPKKAASGFLMLVNLGYIMVATMVNGGEKYNDEKQARRYSLFLSAEAASKLNSLDGRV